MSTPEYDKLIERFRAWCKAAHGRQQLIADRLKVSKQLVSGWLSGYRAISLDEWTQIQAVINKESAGAQFLEENTSMKTIVDPPAAPPANTRAHSEPKTLFQAKEQLEILRLEVARLKAAAVTPLAKSALTAPTAKPKLAGSGADASPTYPTVTTPGANQPNKNQMAVNFEAPPLALLPPDADCPARIQKYLDAMTESEVRDCLRGEHDPLRLGMMYKELQKRKALTAIG